MTTEFKRNKKTGILEAWRNGKYVGDIITMGNIADAKYDKQLKDKDNEQSRSKKLHPGSNGRA